MGKLIIVCGKPGSGKTTLASALAKDLGWPCLHKDTLKEAFYDNIGGATLEDSKKIGKACVFTLYDLVKEQLNYGANLIVESPFQFEGDYHRIDEWEKITGSPTMIVECEISEEERVARCRTRPRHVSHHDADRLIEQGTHEALTVDYSKMPGTKVKITTDKPTSELVKDIRAQFEV